MKQEQKREGETLLLGNRVSTVSWIFLVRTTILAVFLERAMGQNLLINNTDCHRLRFTAF